MGYEHGAALLTDDELYSRIIEMGGRIENNDGRLTADSSASLDLAHDLLDAALREYAKRALRSPKPYEKRGLLPLRGQVLQTVDVFDSYDAAAGRFDTTEAAKAHVTTSRVDKGQSMTARGLSASWEAHKVVIDLDLPARLVPSSTPGHFHLYVDHEMTWEQYAAVLQAMGNAGLLEDGYVSASLARKFTAVRLPWVRKEDTDERVAAIEAVSENPF